MTSTQSHVMNLIARARAGDGDALGELLEKHRPYLRVLALRMLDRRLASRVDASDLVQQTCLSVHRRIRNFVGQDEAQFVAWLKEIHECNIQNAVRDHLQLQKRSVEREEPWTEDRPALGESGAQRYSSPSQRAMRGEDAVRLAAALMHLPDDQRTAVRLKFLEGLPLAEIAAQMDRSEDSVVGLVRRGLKALRKHLHDKNEETP